ncbi:hypothetical protein [Clostridium pasteurianum]|uniref:hypothetical protein n=1 Tax=Clostridium pasteurianum TaxID=1501 RepID=UPI0008DBB6F5|nr:hypothetical protein [Clostridium pasteurianum]AOZ78243.1 hypothetical protein AQ984_04750 [Clostridium pasteurianum]
MKIDIETAKKYLKNSKQAILDAKNSVFTEMELQSAIDEIIQDITPELKGKIYILRSTWFDVGNVVTSQNYLDEVIKPFVRKINKELNWRIGIPADIMKRV